MKHLAILFLSTLSLSIYSSNLLADENLKGHWVYKNDKCKSGVEPKDRWNQLAYRNINLFINDSEFAATVVFQTLDFSTTCSGGVSGPYAVKGDKFVETIKIVNNGNLAACGIAIPASEGMQITIPYEVKENLLLLNKPSGGESVCDKEGDLIEIYERAAR